MSRSALGRIASLALILAAFGSAPAAGDIAGPDETAASPYGPLAFGKTYSGAFTNPNDVDYLAFTVATAGETLGFTVQNTTQACQDPYQAGCPVYATLMDSTGANQVGGSSSAAGTIATYGDTESFTWTFAQAGSYFVLMESDGDLPDGSPSYTVTVTSPPSAPGSGGGAGSAATLLHALTVKPHQRGSAINATIVLSGQAGLRLVLQRRVAGRWRGVEHRLVRNLGAGRHRVKLPLPTAYRHQLAARGKLSVRLQITIIAPLRQPFTVTRRVTLVR